MYVLFIVQVILTENDSIILSIELKCNKVCVFTHLNAQTNRCTKHRNQTKNEMFYFGLVDKNICLSHSKQLVLLSKELNLKYKLFMNTYFSSVS